ncbi:MAG: DNA polymerase domain-containing protein [Victivallales bacterium]|nr:DNA polymerase domain-containing protein [Victivallales bacterium]
MLQLDKITSSRYERVTAAEPLEDGRAIIWQRDGNNVSHREIPFRPFVLLTRTDLLDGAELEHTLTPLSGSGPLQTVASFTGIGDYERALKYLKQVTGRTPSAPGAPYLVISDLTQQLLISARFRLFRGMSFRDLRRLQFDIETLNTAGYEFSNPQREGDAVIIISLSDNTGWEQVISQQDYSEKELLEEFVRLVRERDPDVLEGHNICRFDLPYLETRAKRHKVKLRLGRDGSIPVKRQSRFNAAERTINYPRYDIFGRHVADTFHLTTFYDISHRNLENYGLKQVARHFRVAAPDRTYIEGSRITAAWSEDRSRLLAYALDDVRETRAIADIMSPSYFYQTQLVPLGYQNCIVRGNATRINALLTAEYLAVGHSIPFPEPATAFAGALTRAFHAGVFENIWHCDIRSLYPSIILAEEWAPKRDELHIFPALLDKLRRFRLDAKDAERAATDAATKDFFNSLQTTFKILINSFYGYLGFAQGNFNDYAMAERVTARGREILTLMLDHLTSCGANVIEMDTDGIYFQPPPGVTDQEAMEQTVQSVLPPGIEVELDATYPAMFCYKSKNYALLNADGEITIAGAALKSRGLEPFQRDYIHEFLSRLLAGRADTIDTLYREYCQAIETRTWPLNRLAKTETLKDSVDTYRRKIAGGKSRRAAAYELAAQSSRDYRQGDQISYYITGIKAKVAAVDNCCLLAEAPPERNENIAYYRGKLDDLHRKFSAFREEVSTAADAAEDHRQMELEL